MSFCEEIVIVYRIPHEQVEKRRPVQIAARRQRELMAILRDHLNQETAEWFDADKIHFDHDTFDEHESRARDDVVPLAGSIQE